MSEPGRKMDIPTHSTFEFFYVFYKINVLYQINNEIIDVEEKTTNTVCENRIATLYCFRQRTQARVYFAEEIYEVASVSVFFSLFCEFRVAIHYGIENGIKLIVPFTQTEPCRYIVW